ncbi:hypothetical protein PZA18_15640 [Chitinimonas sp. DQS-5]|uniref:Type IV pilus biogenesis protein PilP n=1 Tax=Parachitinimonas caeni TaxID=3031301 RepID=A0ABT7E3K7_9NEIS|nr:hypothetical protein [Parachitinimonas caeni]
MPAGHPPHPNTAPKALNRLASSGISQRLSVPQALNPLQAGESRRSSLPPTGQPDQPNPPTTTRPLHHYLLYSIVTAAMWIAYSSNTCHADMVDDLVSKQGQLLQAEKMKKLEESSPKPKEPTPPIPQLSPYGLGAPTMMLPQLQQQADEQPVLVAVYRSGDFYMADILHRGTIFTISKNQPFISTLEGWKLVGMTPSTVEMVKSKRVMTGKGKQKIERDEITARRTLYLSQIAAGREEKSNNSPSSFAPPTLPGSFSPVPIAPVPR